MPLTNKQLRALTILKDTSYLKPMRVFEFAKLMWPDSNMHTSTKNQGNGATRGKAAWLCGGSYTSKLQRMGIVSKTYGFKGDETSQCYISEEGKKQLNK